jgi:hypothetical protein
MSRADYVQAVLRAYLALRETPAQARPTDRVLALDLHQQQISIDQIRAAILLAAGRRIHRSPEAPKLAKIRSLAYFVPVIRELDSLENIEGYLKYLQSTARREQGQHPGSDYTE